MIICQQRLEMYSKKQRNQSTRYLPTANVCDDTLSLATLGSFGSVSWVAEQFAEYTTAQQSTNVQVDESIEYNYECTICSRAFATDTNLRTHMNQCHSNYYTGKNSSNQHSSITLDDEEDDEDTEHVEIGAVDDSPDKDEDPQRGFKCPHCGKGFTRRSEMGRHVGVSLFIFLFF